MNKLSSYRLRAMIARRCLRQSSSLLIGVAGDTLVSCSSAGTAGARPAYIISSSADVLENSLLCTVTKRERIVSSLQ